MYTESITRHDHAVAHTRTALCSRSLFSESLPQLATTGPRLRVLDLNGSPGANEHNELLYHMSITTACKVLCPEDELRRVTKWGAQLKPDGTPRWHDLWDREIGVEGSSISPEAFKEFDAITAVHVLYYYSQGELLKLLSRGNDDLVLYGLVHKFAGNTGTLNNKEQTWVKTKDKGVEYITQTNTGTNRSYKHQSNDWMFSNNSWQLGDKGLTWDLHMVCPDTYAIKMKVYKVIAPTPQPLNCSTCGHVNMIKFDDTPPKTHSPAQLVTNSTEYLERYQTAVVKQGDKYIEYTIKRQYQPMFTDARRRMANKARTMEEYKSHCSLLETKIKRYQTDNHVTVSIEDATALKTASYWMDLTDQIQRDTEMFDSMWKDSRHSNKLYTYGHHGTERHIALTAIDAALQSGATKGVISAALVAAKALIGTKQ